MRLVEFDLESRAVGERPAERASIRSGRGRLIWWVDLDWSEAGALRELAQGLELSESEVASLADRTRPSGLVERDGSATLMVEVRLGEAEGSQAPRLCVHLTSSACITIGPSSLSCLEKLRRTFRNDFRYAQSPGFLLFLVLENLIEDCARALQPLDDEAERIADRIYVRFDPAVNSEILALKRRMLDLRHSVLVVRDALMRLSGRRTELITESGRQYLGNLYGHVQSLAFQLDSSRELLSSLLESYMAVQAQRLNETMKVLTLFAAVILPMTLVVGIYGMNFHVMPETSWRFGYPLALLLMLGAGGVVFLFFRRKGWV